MVFIVSREGVVLVRLLTHEDFFFCYDLALSNKLKENGLRYICVGYNAKTQNTFHLYQKTQELQGVLDQWRRSA